MNVDGFLDRQYDHANYNCAHFAAELWAYVTGENIDRLCFAVREKDGRAVGKMIKERTPLQVPVTPSLCRMESDALPHIGVYLNGKVFHLSRDGARADDLVMLHAQYRKLSFYK